MELLKNISMVILSVTLITVSSKNWIMLNVYKHRQVLNYLIEVLIGSGALRLLKMLQKVGEKGRGNFFWIRREASLSNLCYSYAFFQESNIFTRDVSRPSSTEM